MSKKSKLASLLSITGVMFGAYVGPGFASGTQTVNYFLNKGTIGVFIGPAIAMVLCFIFTFLLFTINRIYAPRSYREAYGNIYRSKNLNRFFVNFKELQVIAVVFISLAAQISTAANLLNSVYGMPIAVGSVIFVLAILLLSLFGAGLLRKAGAVLSICIIAICVYIGIKCLGAAWPGMSQFMEGGTTYRDYGYTSAPYAWFSMLMIVVFFMNGYEACVPASKGIVTEKKDVWIVSLSTALLSGISTMVFTMIFAAGMPDILDETIPTLWALGTLTKANMAIQTIYVVFAIAAMLSSSMSFIFTVTERFQGPLGNIWKGSSEFLRKLAIALFFIIICMAGSTFGLINIIRYGYNTFTMIVGPVMLIPLIVSVPYRIYRDKKDGIISQDK